VKRGEIRWYTFRDPGKRRPVLALTRDEVIGTAESNRSSVVQSVGGALVRGSTRTLIAWGFVKAGACLTEPEITGLPLFTVWRHHRQMPRRDGAAA
jgi:hypothetical protein